MRKTVLFLCAAMTSAVLFGACSSKQINETADAIGSDISRFADKVTAQH